MIHQEMVDSPAEHSFIHNFQKFCDKEIIPQYEVGGYRLDFFCEGIGIEIDGKEFHDINEDYKRDTEILRYEVDKIVRFKAEFALYRPYFCSWFLCRYIEPLRTERPFLKNQFQMNGIYTSFTEMNPIITKHNGYKKFVFNIDYMSSMNEEKYFNDISEPNFKPDMSEYLKTKQLSVLIHEQEIAELLYG